jgi:hypothetical protein
MLLELLKKFNPFIKKIFPFRLKLMKFLLMYYIEKANDAALKDLKN